MKNSKTKPIKGGFHILVVPKADVEVAHDGAVPPIFATKDIRVNIFRAAAYADENRLGACVWVFNGKSERDDIVQRLRELADWVEGTGKDFDAFRARHVKET